MLDGLPSQDSSIAKRAVRSAYAHRRPPGITIEDLGQEAALFCCGTALHGEQLRIPLQKHLENLIAVRIADSRRHGELDTTEVRRQAEARAVPDELRKFVKRKVRTPEKHPAPGPGQDSIPSLALLERGWTRALISKHLKVDRTTPSRYNRGRPVCWYDIAQVQKAEEALGGALRIRAPRNGGLNRRKEIKIPRLASTLEASAHDPAPPALPESWLSWEGEPSSTLSHHYGIEYPWVIDELVFATDTKTLHIRVGIDLPEVSKVAGHKGTFRFLPCPKCGRKRCEVCSQGIERAWYRGGYPIGDHLAVPTIVYGQAQMIRCPDCGVCEINLLQDLQIWADPNAPRGVRQVPNRLNVRDLTIRPKYTLRGNKQRSNKGQ